ncbi:hypothetical protein Mboo_1964 [Methanoregula boonei 6A8]|uniref:Uncharacterized protein n=2 Tax=Methanoregula TaxID=395331 RepID=A7I9R8_METB6|nr:hypothetical protein Mboo_1964 [Methanoregula boonei 6A8]
MHRAIVSHDVILEARMNSTILAVILLILIVLPVSADLTVINTSTPQTIVKADTVTLSGSGAQNGSITLWIFGSNYFATMTTTPDKKGNYTFTLKPADTNRFSPGKYAFLIQDPGANQVFEIGPLSWSDGSIRISDRGKVVENIGSPATFPANIVPVAETVLNASDRPDVDDIFTPYYFYVEEPTIHFNRENSAGSLPDQTTGEALLITGTTNIGTENQLQVSVRNATSGDLVTSQTIPVVEGANTNQWTYSLNEPGLPPGSYTVTVGEQKYTTKGSASAQLMIREYLIAGNSSFIPQPELPPGTTPFDVLLPLLISGAALAIIGIIMLVSLRK